MDNFIADYISMSLMHHEFHIHLNILLTCLSLSLSLREVLVMMVVDGIVVMFVRFSLGLNMLYVMTILLKMPGLVVLIFVGFESIMVSLSPPPFLGRPPIAGQDWRIGSSRGQPLPPPPLGRLPAAGQGWWVGGSQGMGPFLCCGFECVSTMLVGNMAGDYFKETSTCFWATWGATTSR